MTIKKKKKKLKSIPLLKRTAQKYFNNYIRKRDILGPTFVCISCGKTLPAEAGQCGHYYPVKGFGHLRYNEDNAHVECRGCNGFADAHLIFYTWNLITKIGLDEYNKLFHMATEEHVDWKREQLEEIIKKYKLLTT